MHQPKSGLPMERIVNDVAIFPVFTEVGASLWKAAGRKVDSPRMARPLMSKITVFPR